MTRHDKGSRVRTKVGERSDHETDGALRTAGTHEGDGPVPRARPGPRGGGWAAGGAVHGSLQEEVGGPPSSRPAGAFKRAIFFFFRASGVTEEAGCRTCKPPATGGPVRRPDRPPETGPKAKPLRSGLKLDALGEETISGPSARISSSAKTGGIRTLEVQPPDHAPGRHGKSPVRAPS